jgi:hypothetical protein
VDLEDVLVEAEIRQVLSRYCRGVDRGDRDLVASVYHAGAIDRHGAFEGTGDQFAEVITRRDPNVQGSGAHHITNVTIEREGDAANVESYFLAFHPIVSDGVEQLPVAGGRYVDRFELRDGSWLIAERTVIIDFSRGHLEGDIWPAGSWQHGGFVRGRRGPDDHSYEAFSPTFALPNAAP